MASIDHESNQRTPRGVLRNLWSSLGPGLVTGAADDDPSGIATYSVAGAQLGTTLLWTPLITWPLMAAVQNMCARIGMVTGHGLASTFRTKFPRGVLAVCSQRADALQPEPETTHARR